MFKLNNKSRLVKVNSFSFKFKLSHFSIQYKSFLKELDEALLNSYAAITILEEKKADSLQFFVVRINLIFSQYWALKSALEREKSLNLLRRSILKFLLKKKINEFTSSKLVPLFSDEKSKQIQDEITRSFRVINFSLDDYFSENFMQRSLPEIIKEDILCEKETNEENINSIAEHLSDFSKLSLSELLVSLKSNKI